MKKSTEELILTEIIGIKTTLVRMDGRFDEIDKRFEQVDKRFDEMDERFERIDTTLAWVGELWEGQERRTAVLERARRR
jgi:hypothetical protein